jgi:hypothetical protein
MPPARVDAPTQNLKRRGGFYPSSSSISFYTLVYFLATFFAPYIPTSKDGGFTAHFGKKFLSLQKIFFILKCIKNITKFFRREYFLGGLIYG